MRWLAALIVAASTASAATIEESIGDAAYLAYGETFAAWTGRLTGPDTNGTPTAGSCTLVAPHWALTAAHVVHEMTRAEVVIGDQRHRVDRIYAHRDWRSTDYGWHDIALVHVARPFSAQKYPTLSEGTESLQTVAAVAGYGMTGTLSKGLERGDGRLRAGTVALSGTDRSVWVCKIGRIGQYPACIAPGDSGGPLWAAGIDGIVRLSGVNSFVARTGSPARYVYGEESGHTRVSLYREWIDEVTGGLDVPCTMPGCREPH